MTQVRINALGGEIDAVSAAGVPAPHEGNVGCTLASGTTYYFVVGDPDSTYKSVHLTWDAAIIVTFTLWGCDLPLVLGEMGGGGADTTNNSQAKGAWLQINPTTATVYNVSDDGTTGGATVTNATVAVAGGTAGGAIYDLGNVPTKRLRIRATVAGTGGKVRCVTHGKE